MHYRNSYAPNQAIMLTRLNASVKSEVMAPRVPDECRLSLFYRVTWPAMPQENRLIANGCGCLKLTVHLVYFLQEYSPANTNEYDHNIEERSVGSPHDEYEILAQATCTSISIANGVSGFTYAIRRFCYGRVHYTHNCQRLCTNPIGSATDQQTKHLKWRSIGGIHVYTPRPSSTPGTVQRANLGLKVLWVKDYDTNTKCGPNFCCCFVQI